LGRINLTHNPVDPALLWKETCCRTL